MSKKENARAYLENYYPDIAAMADLDQLQQIDDQFIKSDLKVFKSDIIYRCQFKNTDKAFYFSLIWEHKSKSEKFVAIQIGLYIFQLLYKQAKSKDKEVEPIIPLLFYNGKEDWQPKTIIQLFADHPYFKNFQQYLPNFDFLFLNISQKSEQELLSLQLAFFRSAMLSMSLRSRPNLILQYISVIFEVIDQDNLKATISYVLGIIERSPKQLQQELKNIQFKTKDNVMSTLAMLREEGRVEGRVEGRIEGRIEGKIKKTINTLLNTLIELPQLDPKTIATILALPYKSVFDFVELVKKQQYSNAKKYILNHFLKGIELEKKEYQNIYALLKKAMAKQKKG
jgi:predicted transposase YdaD